MENRLFEMLERAAREPKALDRTTFYVAKCLERFLKKREYMLICFTKHEFPYLGTIFEQAVLQLDAVPIFWGPDRKWKTLLRQAFATRATAIVGPPRVILGLSKLAKATGTPLFIRNVVTAGYPCTDWMIDGIIKGLDCQTWGCFGPGTGAVVGGFSCGKSRGVHVRQDAYNIEIVNEAGNPVSDGAVGFVQLRQKDGDICFRTSEYARLECTPCACGQTSPRLMDIVSETDVDPAVEALDGQLQAWTSILDCRLEKGPYGLEMELVVFRGEKLPNLPSCAKRIIRPWNPEQDEPMCFGRPWENLIYSGESH